MKVAIIGVGSQGYKYAKLISKEIKELKIEALVRVSETKKEYFKNSSIHIYNELDGLLSDIDNNKIQIDSFIITTPHKAHKEIALSAFRRGINVLLEKPVSYILSEALEINNCYLENKEKYPNLLYGIIYQNRLLSNNLYLKNIVENKTYGNILNVNIINNSFFRPHAYFEISKWRGTYKGEGGALLINQASHSLDLIYYLFNLPKTLVAYQRTQVHKIDAEDSICAIFNYDYFSINYTSSLNDPFNTNLFEITFENAKISVKDGKIYLYLLDKDYLSYLNEKNDLFIKPSYTVEDILVRKNEPYKEIFNNFAQGIVINGLEGMYSLYMINALTYSSYTNMPVDLCLDTKYIQKFNTLYEELLNKLCK